MLGDVEGLCSKYFFYSINPNRKHLAMKVQTSPENTYVYDLLQYFVSTVQQLKHYLYALIVSSASVYSIAGPC